MADIVTRAEKWIKSDVYTRQNGYQCDALVYYALTGIITTTPGGAAAMIRGGVAGKESYYLFQLHITNAYHYLYNIYHITHLSYYIYHITSIITLHLSYITHLIALIGTLSYYIHHLSYYVYLISLIYHITYHTSITLHI